MKRMVLWMLILVIGLSACSANSHMPVDTTNILPSTSETRPTTPPTTNSYAQDTDSRIQLYPFVYTGSMPDLDSYTDTRWLDISQLQLNCIYLYDPIAKTTTQVSEPVYHTDIPNNGTVYSFLCMYLDRPVIFYALESEPWKLYSTDFSNENPQLYYEAADNTVINFIDVNSDFGYDTLFLIEGYQTFFSLDLKTFEKTIYTEQFYMWRAKHSSDYLDIELAPVIHWWGALNEDVPSFERYVYSIPTGEVLPYNFGG